MLAGWMVGWPMDGWSLEPLVGWLVCLLVGWLEFINSLLVGWLVGW